MDELTRGRRIREELKVVFLFNHQFEAAFDGDEKIGRNRDTSNRVFIDECLVFKLLPLCSCEWKLTSYNHCCCSGCSITHHFRIKEEIMA